MKSQHYRPILRGRIIGGFIYVHCPWCDREHMHAIYKGFEDKPRLRFGCSVDGPFKATGYYVAPFRQMSGIYHNRLYQTPKPGKPGRPRSDLLARNDPSVFGL